ncbi:MAG TPA: signal recognition particle-docking protein FtsY [Candidatus Caccopulliclostridium gallistercoris]|uniref:Signal recognition particle receptor FtsY n=1 Tax=Candidatus Caccopulliclostridium gallistercoris TaxID=2840719 RepID=A0A9D1NFG1_9FIRM|nr:signal recognition particle-docking protein FtsY [Candidatus Caccopulliclostridium gallistercoris]
MGLFKKIAEALRKTREAFRRKLDALFSHGELNDEFYEELEDILISSDVGVESAMEICEELRTRARKEKLRTAEDVRGLLKEIIEEDMQAENDFKIEYPAVITIVGVNGVGKTTSIGKLANYFKNQKKDVCLVAGDTFRAAASEQLSEWAARNKVRVIKHEEGADAAAVVFDGITSAKARKTDVLIVDTAGRLHTKTNLMEELGKINRVIEREYPEANKYTFIVLDATTGQNALSQIEHFNEYVDLDGIILTKLDGTAKGGVVITISREYNLPVVFIGVGEGINDLEEFNAKDFADNLF